MIPSADRNNQVRSDALEHRQEGEAGGMLSPADLATFWNVHVNTIYRDIRKGALPAYRLPGGQIRIRVVDARRYGRPIE